MENLKLFDDSELVIGQLELFDPREYEERKGEYHDQDE
jgi:hypothetical protein